MKYFWALLLFTLGLIFLGAEFGLWGYDQVRQLWQFWPLVLVFAGLDMLFKRKEYGWIVMLLAFVASSFLVYGTIFDQQNYFGMYESQREMHEVVDHEITIDSAAGVTSQDLTIEAGAIDMKIEGETSKLVDGVLRSNIMEPKTSVDVDGNVARTKISFDGERAFWFGHFNLKNELKVALSTLVENTLTVKVGASSLNFDLTPYAMKRIDLDAGASSINMKLGERLADDFVLDANTGAASIKLSIPENVNVLVESESALSSVEKPADVENAAKTITVKVSSAATSVEIVRY